MADQLSFASLDFAAKRKRTKQDVFLSEMGQIIPWSTLEALIEPHYPVLGQQGGLLRHLMTLDADVRGAIEQRVRDGYLVGLLDGPRSFPMMIRVVRGVVPV